MRERNCQCYKVQFLFDRKLAIVTYYDSFIHLIYERSWTISIRQEPELEGLNNCTGLSRKFGLQGYNDGNVAGSLVLGCWYSSSKQNYGSHDKVYIMKKWIYRAKIWIMKNSLLRIN